MLVLFKLLLLSAALATVWSHNFLNEYDQPFDFRCPYGSVINYIYSEHHDYFEDRRFEILCRSQKTTECAHSGYVNAFDQPVNFICPGDKVMTGIESYHDNFYEDRRFSFQCCRVSRKKLCNCYMTNDVNTWDMPMTLRVGFGQAIQGAHSYHNNYYEDRIWKFQLCQLKDKC
ncbi:dermatopontin-like isoform X1 [Physella acuta]|uniref:dermatopontin-like isoform X1 n=1 Tax=Physella acuta TaxID=109671 RepID=UPI0027DBEFE1|nr:dermatopontin-like isoform X1 [Physella acuta]